MRSKGFWAIFFSVVVIASILISTLGCPNSTGEREKQPSRPHTLEKPPIEKAVQGKLNKGFD